MHFHVEMFKSEVSVDDCPNYARLLIIISYQMCFAELDHSPFYRIDYF